MSELPEGWTTTDLEAVIQNHQSGFASGKKDVAAGVPHLRMNNIGVKGEVVLDLVRTVPPSLAKPQYNLASGDVLVCTTNSSKLVGKCARFDLEGRFAFSNHLTRLRPRPGIILGDYLARHLWLLWQQGEFEDKCKHWVNQSTLPKEELLSTSILVPPLNEQHRIMARLDELLGKVEACQKRLAKIPVILKRFRQSVLAAACSGALTADWREKLVDNGTAKQVAQNELASANSNSQSDLPGEWRWIVLSELISDSFYGPRFAKEEYGMQGTPTIRTTDINDRGRIALKEPPRIALSPEKLEALGLKHEDLLVTRTGATIGKCALYDESIGPALPSAYLIRFRLRRQRVSAKYLLLFLLSPSGQALLTGGATAVAQPNVNAKTIGGFHVPLPPSAEQLEIARRVEALFKFADQIETRYRKAQGEVDKLIQSILAKAFRGELVPTEAELARRETRYYEPASVLVERIRESKDKANESRDPSESSPKSSGTNPRARDSAKRAARRR